MAKWVNVRLTSVIGRLVNMLIGSRAALSLENRLFNSMTLIALFIMFFNIPFNYFSGLKITAAIFALLSTFLGLLYYLARFKKQLTVSITIGSGLVITLFSVNYLFSAGVGGASLLSFMLAFMLIIIISPKRLYALWVSLSLCIVLGLLWAEYHYPSIIQVSYEDDRAKFIDIAMTYATGIVISFFSLFFLKEAYAKEKKSADDRAVELEKLNAEKLKLFSIVSHDLQAPLSSLHSYVRLIASDRLTSDERKQVERGLSNALHGTQEMLSNLLVWSQGQLRGHRVDLIKNNIKDVLAPVLDVQKIYAGQKKILLHTELDDSLVALLDRDMLQLIVRNLINNAIKFTLPSGRIHVSALRVGKDCQIVVQDNGIGIPPERQATLFALDTQSTYGTSNERGIGLGLFLCREYAHAQQGTLSFESMPGEGTTFYLTLPLIT